MAISGNESFTGAGGSRDPLAHLAHFAHEALKAMDEEETVEVSFGNRRLSMPHHEAEIAFRKLDQLTGHQEPTGAEKGEITITLKQAAKGLNVPVDYVMGLIESDILPYRMEDGEYNLLAEPFEAYRKRTYIEANKALDFIAREAREMGLYD